MSDLKRRIASWRNGSAGFFKFLDDVKPRVRSHRGGHEPYVLGPRERAEIARALDGDHSTVVLCWPRRHGKTLATAFILLWRFLTRPTENIALIANSERQATDVAFRTLATAFEQTPFLKQLVASRTVVVSTERLELPATGSVIQGFSSNPAVLWGKKLSACQVSELHAAKSEAVLEAVSGSLIDTAGSLLLIDSTVGPRSSPLYALNRIAETGADSKLFFSHITYRDLDHACDEAPPWIEAAQLRSLAARMLPQTFATYHLNQWGAASSTLFPETLLARIVHEYPLDRAALTAGAACAVGAGVDRAFGLSAHGDSTFTACVLKVTHDDGDDHFYVLDASPVLFSRLAGIKKHLGDYGKSFGLSRVCVESYGGQDVADWAQSQPGYGGNTEVVHPSRKLKYQAFTSLYSLAAEGRLHVHPKFATLVAEMRTLEVVADGLGGDGEAGVPQFRHAKGCHDDAVHALLWAAHSLRDVELNAYELEGVDCRGSGPAVRACALNSGYLIPPCATHCRSMRQASALYEGYLTRGSLIPLAFDEFVINKIKNVGAHSMPR